MLCQQKHISYRTSIAHQNNVSQKKNSLWQQKRLCDTQKSSCGLNIFRVAQKRIA